MNEILPPITPVATQSNKLDNNKTIALLFVGIACAIGLVIAGLWGYDQSKTAREFQHEVQNLQSNSAEQQSKISKLEDELAQRKDATGEANIDKNVFQSVFLKNEQVYFGKITAINESQLTLENIYYMKDNGGGDVSLIKLGNELHGPQDKMFIERKELSYWENLKEDSQVTKAILEYEKANPR